MDHMYIHMLCPPVLTKISFTSCLCLTFIAFIRKENYPVCYLLQLCQGHHCFNPFNEESLRIAIEANIHSVDFLDVNLDLKTGLHKRFLKPNQTPLYVHSLSNHPKQLKENIPKAVNQRLSKL